MSTSIRRTSTTLAEKLFQEPHRFDFFQAVRLLEWIFREQRHTHSPMLDSAVGGYAAPDKEIVHFRVANSFNFPASAIAHLRKKSVSESTILSIPLEMDVTFMGLTGPNGVLPDHYTELLLQRIHFHKDYALRDFLDIFNHRSISLYYRAWEKYRVPFAWERSKLDSSKEDSFTTSLRCFIGLGTAQLNDRLQVSNDVPLYYAGHFAHRPRSALALETLLSDFLKLPIQIIQFQGRWLYLDNEEQTRLPGAECLSGQYHQLGVDAVLGESVWDICSCFYIKIEHLSYSQFIRFLPNGKDYLRLCHLTRLYVGPQFTFAVQPVLTDLELPLCKLARDDNYEPYLGWNTWLTSSCPLPKDQEIDAPIYFWKDLSE